jgi:putative tryptophan/tyrosine transport system substrate-binding protein
MKRRDLIAGGLVVAYEMATLSSMAQTAKRARLGYLSGGPPTASRESTLGAFEAALGELGWKGTETLVIEERFANGDLLTLPRLASELVALRPNVIVTTGGPETKSLQVLTQDIPIVFLQVAGDPVSLGLVDSIARPGRNITGFTQGPQILWGKRLDLLTELLGHQPRRLAWLGNPKNAGNEWNWIDAKDAAGKIGADIARVQADDADAIDKAFDALEHVDALLVPIDFLFVVSRSRIAALAAEKRIPAVYENRIHILAGGLMSYGADLRENFRQGAGYVDRILKGARIADLPVVQASRFELLLNTVAAKAIGLTIPPSLLIRADEVIE